MYCKHGIETYLGRGPPEVDTDTNNLCVVARL